jgi:hypothetical protein
MFARPVGQADGEIEIGFGEIDFVVGSNQRELQVGIGSAISGRALPSTIWR